MANPVEKKESEFTLIQLLPNMLTIAAICAGLSAIRFAVEGNYTLAVLLVLAASVLDGLDGRLARRLGANSKMGAELDSLADFLNFGVTPPLIIYFWGLQEIPSKAWVFVLIYSVCCVLRLARFNVGSKSEFADQDNAFFEGVPAPAGALLAMLPMYLAFAFPDMARIPALVICFYIAFIGLLMISTIPTWSFKSAKIARGNVRLFLVGVAFAIAAIMTYAWLSLIVLCAAYVLMVFWAGIRQKVRPS